MISQNTIQQILGRLDIVDVIGGFVKLKKRGTNYLGLCPFHNEKTPSFTVSPSKEIYKCFGCGRSGNTISFLMEHEKYSYVESLRWLANKYGIDIEETFTSDEDRQQLLAADSLYIINSFAQQFFSKMLFESEEGKDIGLSYLKERGFREEIIRKFQLGYSPEQRDAFTKEALEKQFNRDVLLKTGLVVLRNEHLTDNYRERIIFPVHNHSGKVLGFGARVLKKNDKAPKYINTPENEIYVKSKILYGSHFARQAIDKADECLLVEGYTDVISLHQAGIENVVASGGTSLTQDQLRLIKKYTNNLTIIYDGDSAGVKAALRGLEMALEEGLNVKLVLIPDNEDPDSYVNNVGAFAFKEFIQKNKRDFILFQLDVALKNAGKDSSKKSEVVNQIAETISKINKAEDFTRQQDYIKQCAEILKIDESGLHTLVNKFIRNRVSTLEKKLPFEEAKAHEENARRDAAADYDDSTFILLFKDELQEREVARVLLEHGTKKWNEFQLIAEYIISEIPEEGLLDNQDIMKLINAYKELLLKDKSNITKNYFIYHPDTALSSLTVALLNFPYEESERWRNEFSQATGYQDKLFEQDYESFIKTITKEKENTLTQFLKTEEDKTNEEIESALGYLKLRKVKRMLIENQADLEKPHSNQEYEMLQKTHLHLKEMEKTLTQKMGTVIIR
ncbi:MAG: DNA primase [Bacteroidetes bacterium]|nr:DNA primase [Bacteroidota bacterium]MBS1930079.1 DNA primase [Bacteroidota bacterium]